MARKETIEPNVARQMFTDGKAKANMCVEGALDLAGLELKSLPAGLKCYELDLSNNPIETIPSDLQVECALMLNECRNLTSLPKGLKTGTLELRNCTELESLPERLDVWYLDAAGCTRLKSFPKKASIGKGNLSVAGCVWLSSLPNYLGRVSTLDISDCPLIDSLPESLELGLWIDVAGSGLDQLPKRLMESGLRWRGVPVDYRIAFFPETIKAKEALAQTNAEIRRVMIERMGFERFFEEAKAKKIDKDTDPGGKRELLRIVMKDDEDIVCLSCSCPSTQRHYLLRVPPTIMTCHAAAAWMAGFNDPSKYKPVIET